VHVITRCRQVTLETGMKWFWCRRPMCNLWSRTGKGSRAVSMLLLLFESYKRKGALEAI